jgi:metal-responsive CopG/Arc/MetJ family transcriptional regulator
MGSSKVAITLDSEILKEVDELVKRRVFPNRSRAIQEAVREQLSRLNRAQLARECAKLDASLEQALAEEGLGEDVSDWPEY